jgi:DNA-binding NarL/FixJ family response regulator
MVKPIQILLVGGDTLLRKALTALIRSTPDMVVVGQTAAAHQALADEHLTRVDVVVLLCQSAAEALVLASSLLAQPRPPRVLVISHELDGGELAAAVDAGRLAYLPLGTPPAEILQKVRAVHRGQSLPGNDRLRQMT